MAIEQMDLDGSVQSSHENIKNENVKLSNSAVMTEQLDAQSFECVVELKISRFLDQLGSYFPENLHALFMNKTEKPLIHQVLRRTGGNQVHAARILGINRNTLRKKMKIYSL